MDNISYHPLIALIYSFVGVTFLLPIRVLCLGIFVCCAGILNLIATRKLHPRQFLEMPTHERLWCIAGMRWIATGALAVLGVPIVREASASTRCPANIPTVLNANCTIVSNHVSILDILYFITKFGFPSFVAKESISRVPIVSGSANLMRSIYVNRDSTQDRSKTLARIQERQQEFENRTTNPVPGNCLVLFPEGTTSSGRTVLPFKRGAFSSLRRVTPVVLHYVSSFVHPSFEILEAPVWITLLLHSPVPSYLNVIWLPDMEPASLLQPEFSYDVRVSAFKNHVRREMLRVLLLQPSIKDFSCDSPADGNTVKNTVLDDDWGDVMVAKQQIKKLCRYPRHCETQTHEKKVA